MMLLMNMSWRAIKSGLNWLTPAGPPRQVPAEWQAHEGSGRVRLVLANWQRILFRASGAEADEIRGRRSERRKSNCNNAAAA